MPVLPPAQPTARERLLEQLDEINGEPSKSDASRRVIAMAGRCKYFEASEDEAVELITDRLKSNPPPNGKQWSDEEIRQRFRDADPDRFSGNGSSHASSNGRAHKPIDATTDYKPFPTDALPSVLRKYVAGGADSIGCDESFVALPLLSSVAAAIGNTTWLTVKSEWNAPSCLWTAVVSESGTHKSPAFKLGTRFLNDQQRLMVAEYHALMEQYKPDSDGPEPRCNQIVTSDTTTEGLAELLKHNRRGIGMMRSELSGWLGSFNRYTGKKGADEAFWQQVFDGDSLTINRKKDGMAWVERPLVSIAGGIQPAVLASSLTEEQREGGLAARFLFAQPPRKPIQWTDDVLNKAVEARTSLLFDRLMEIELNDRPQYLGMDREAKTVFIDHYNRHHQGQAELVGDHAASWSKLIGYVPRLALILHVAECADVDCHHDLPPVTDLAMLAAITLGEWFKQEADRVYSIIDDDPGTRKMRRYADWIKRKHGGTVTPRDFCRGQWTIKNVAEAEKVLGEMAQAGWGQWDPVSESGPKGGRPKQTFTTY